MGAKDIRRTTLRRRLLGEDCRWKFDCERCFT